MDFTYLTSILHIQEVGVDVAAINEKNAKKVREILNEKGITSFDISGSIGSGKTLLIEKIIGEFSKKKIAVIVGDVDATYDSERIRSHNVPVASVNTGKDCHLDAHRIEHALEKFDLDAVDVLLVENVGNLICPTDFNLGCDHRIVVISVTEGDDTVKKQPAIFAGADLSMVNKIDLDTESVADSLKADAINAGSKKAFSVSLKKNENLDEVFNFIRERIEIE
ncbi:MAG: hydrogenase nickel incorporation protein HypB [Candidatus Altiarchaeota archaeon]